MEKSVQQREGKRVSGEELPGGKDRRERMRGGIILYIKESIQAYEITLKSEADCEEAIWCNIITRNMSSLSSS